MHRRNFFALAAGALATSCVPEIAPAKVVEIKPYEGSSSVCSTCFRPHVVRVPRVYLARLERSELTQHWLETWRHSTDTTWEEQIKVADVDALDGFSYDERRAYMNELYLRGRER